MLRFCSWDCILSRAFFIKLDTSKNFCSRIKHILELEKDSHYQKYWNNKLASMKNKERKMEVMLMIICLTRFCRLFVFSIRPLIEAIKGRIENIINGLRSIVSMAVPQKSNATIEIVPVNVAAT